VPSSDDAREVGNLGFKFFTFFSHHGEVRPGVFETRANLSFEFFQRVCGNILAENFALQPLMSSRSIASRRITREFAHIPRF
jgi:hypothetical protein